MIKTHKKALASIAGALISLLVASPVLASSFNGVLPVPNAGSAALVPTITMSSHSIGVGQTATVTFTFPGTPSSFTTSNVTAANGTISNLAVTSNPDVYTATFTPTPDFNSSGNVISITPTVATVNYPGVGSATAGIAFDGTNMWASNAYGSSVTKITPSGGQTPYSGIGYEAYSIAFDGTNMWTANNAASSVSKITPSGSVTNYGVGSGTNPIAIAFDGTNMWAADQNNKVIKISPSGSYTTYSGLGSAPFAIAFDGSNMWTANLGDGSVSKITATGTVTTYANASSSPRGIAFDGTNMWVAATGSDYVTKVSPSGAITKYTGTGSEPYGIAFDGTNMWTANEGDGSVTEVSPTGSMTTYENIGDEPYNIAFDGTSMWTANFGDGSVTKITPMSAASSAPYVVGTIVYAQSTAPTRHAITALVVPSALNSANLDFAINDGAPATTTPNLILSLNADPKTVAGYAVSLDSSFVGAGIRPYTSSATNGTFQLPNKPGTYTIYLEYFSTDGDRSSVISHTVSYNSNGTASSSLDTNSDDPFTYTLELGSQGLEVAALQKLLVDNGDLASQTSYGYFGSLTEAALEAFQIKHDIVTSGAPGYGVFGPKTRAEASSLLSQEQGM